EHRVDVRERDRRSLLRPDESDRHTLADERRAAVTVGDADQLLPGDDAVVGIGYGLRDERAVRLEGLDEIPAVALHPVGEQREAGAGVLGARDDDLALPARRHEVLPRLRRVARGDE